MPGVDHQNGQSILVEGLAPSRADRFHLIEIGARGHGRCTLRDQPLTYGLLEADTIAVLDALDARCDHDTDAVTALAGQAGITPAAIESWMNPEPPVIPPIARWGGLDLGDAAELLANFPAPDPAGTQRDPALAYDVEAARDMEPSRP